jgi:Ca2+-binding RTX toxin-like protein
VEGTGGLNLTSAEGSDFVRDDVERFRFSDRTMTYAEMLAMAVPTIDGDAGNNVMTGTAASERINGLGGYDWITPGRGNDTIDGGTGRDMVSYSDQTEVPGRTNLDYMLRLDMGAGTASLFGGEVDTLISIERVTGTIFTDVLRGSDDDDEIRGLGDYDWFIATPGRDTLDGGNGQDMLSFVEWGGSGAATVLDVFSPDGAPPVGAAVNGVMLDLANPGANTALAAGLNLTSIERITGSSYQDVFFGDANQNDFRGLGGYDWFVGSTGGRERYFGGDGIDTVTYYQSTSGVGASLRNGAGLVSGQETGYGTAGDAVRDLYFEIENLVGSNFADSLTGNNERNQLSGLAGDDILFGYGGIDYLKGGAGNDTLNGGGSSDYALYDGNLADYTLTRTASNAVTISGPDGTDSLIDVEYFSFADQDTNIWALAII